MLTVSDAMEAAAVAVNARHSGCLITGGMFWTRIMKEMILEYDKFKQEQQYLEYCANSVGGPNANGNSQ